MTTRSPHDLTERQQSVMERIDRRVPIKVIAQELGVSETRINQHIRALKDIYKVYSLNELVETYRATNGSAEETLSEPAYMKNQVVESDLAQQIASRVDPGEVVINDVLPISGSLPWEMEPLLEGAPAEPNVVPGVLDGDHAIVLRFALIVGIAFGILAAVVLIVTAALALSEMFEGKATVPEVYLESSG